MKRIFSLVFLLFFSCIFPPCSRAEDTAWKIQASLDQHSAEVGMMFLAHVQVLNTSSQEVLFWANSCSYDKHWVTDHPDVLIQSWTCDENELDPVTLPPGDAYKKSIILYVPRKDKTGEVTFRLGFKRMTEKGDVTEPLWSEPITLRIIVPKENGEMSVPTGSPHTQAAASAAGSKQAAAPPPKIYQDAATPIRVQTGEEFLIVLPSNATTGYRWEMKFPEKEQRLLLVESKYIAPEKNLVGAPGDQSYKFKALVTGETKIDLIYRRPWEPNRPADRKMFTVLVQEP